MAEMKLAGARATATGALAIGAACASVFLVPIALASPMISANFRGNTLSDVQLLTGQSIAPPDTMGAIGATEFTEFTNGVFGVYSRAGDAILKTSDGGFWSNAFANSGSAFDASTALSDPRIIFDHASQRWFATQITATFNGTALATPNQVLLARSDTPSAAGPWKAVQFPGHTAGTEFADFPTLGLDGNGVYIAANLGGPDGNLNAKVSLFSIPKTDILAATPTAANRTRFEDQNAATRGFTLQPAVDFGPAKNHNAILAIDADTSLGTLNPSPFLKRSNIQNANTSSATLVEPANVAVVAYSSPGQGRQPDGTQAIDTGDTRLGSSVKQVGNVLWATHEVSASGVIGGQSVIRWDAVDETTNVVLQEGTIGLTDPSHDYYYPSIAANSTGDVVIGFTRSSGATTTSGPVESPSAYAIIGQTAGGLTTFGAPLLLKAGLSNYHLFGSADSERFGDYSETTLDPTDPNTFWTVQEYAGLANNWETQVAAITIPEPATGLIATGAGVLLLRRRRPMPSRIA